MAASPNASRRCSPPAGRKASSVRCAATPSTADSTPARSCSASAASTRPRSRRARCSNTPSCRYVPGTSPSTWSRNPRTASRRWSSSGSWGVSYNTAWLLKHKLMQAMRERDDSPAAAGDRGTRRRLLGRGGASGRQAGPRGARQDAVRGGRAGEGGRSGCG